LCFQPSADHPVGAARFRPEAGSILAALLAFAAHKLIVMPVRMALEPIVLSIEEGKPPVLCRQHFCFILEILREHQRELG
jgi:hypothetical protein